MTMKDRANRILASAENDFLAAKRRKDEIEKALGMLANSGVSDEVLDPINRELELAREDLRDAMIARLVIRSGMRQHNWLDE